MKIYTKIYNVSSSKLKRDYTICLLADIHNTKYASKKIWSKLIEKIKENNPDYILIAGDLVYTADDICNEKAKEKLTYLLSDLSKIAKVLISFGNHDLKDGKKHDAREIKKYFTSLEKKQDITILDNEMISFDDINILGIAPVYEAYYAKFKSVWNQYFVDALLKNSKEYYPRMRNKFNIMITHSPEIISNLENGLNNDLTLKKGDVKHTKKIMELIDLFVCGHMHDGMVPKHWQKLGLVKGDSGIGISEANVFQAVTFKRTKKCRGMHDNFNGKLIVTGGITKSCLPNLPAAVFDKAWAKDITVIKLKKE